MQDGVHRSSSWGAVGGDMRKPEAAVHTPFLPGPAKPRRRWAAPTPRPRHSTRRFGWALSISSFTAGSDQKQAVDTLAFCPPPGTKHLCKRAGVAETLGEPASPLHELAVTLIPVPRPFLSLVLCHPGLPAGRAAMSALATSGVNYRRAYQEPEAHKTIKKKQCFIYRRGLIETKVLS